MIFLFDKCRPKSSLGLVSNTSMRARTAYGIFRASRRVGKLFMDNLPGKRDLGSENTLDITNP